MTQVFSEEVKEIALNKGLYLSESWDEIPDGYNIVQENFFTDEKGHLNLRTAFRSVGTYEQPTAEPREDVHYVRPIEYYPPDYPFDYLRRVYSVYRAPVITLGAPSTYALYPSIVIPRLLNITGSDVPTIYSINSSGLSGLTASVNTFSSGFVPSYWTGMCQYKDRFYIANGGPHQISGFDFATTPSAALTQSNVTNGSLSVEGLVSFRDRIFGWKDDKIYFTEVAAVGGYPEDWQNGNNLIQVQSAEETCVIHNVLPLRDKLYIFTDRGLYQLYAVGAPAGWYLQTISRDYRIFGRNGVCLVKDTFVFTDRNRIYVFDGDTFRQIGQEIDLIVNSAQSTIVAPFEDGLIVSCNFMSNTPTELDVDGDTFTVPWWTLTAGKHYYFDGNTWSQIVFYNDAGTERHVTIIAGMTNKITYYNESLPGSYIVILDEETNTPDPIFEVLFYSNLDFDYDTYNGDTCPFKGKVITKEITNNNPNQYIRPKQAFVSVLSYLDAIEDHGWWSEGFTQTSKGAVALTSGADDFSMLVKLGAPNLVHRLGYYLTVDSDTISDDFVLPARTTFKLRSVQMLVHQENRDPDRQAQA